MKRGHHIEIFREEDEKVPGQKPKKEMKEKCHYARWRKKVREASAKHKEHGEWGCKHGDASMWDGSAVGRAKHRTGQER